jgi:hypothetical protein
MSTEILFQTHLVLGYVAWLFFRHRKAEKTDVCRRRGEHSPQR